MIEKILLNQTYLELGINQHINWRPEKSPHILVCGSTGSGKTYFTKLLLGKIALYKPTAQLYVCDFKGDTDFEFLNGCCRSFRFLDCQDGLQQFYDRFRKRQSGEDSSRNMIVMFYDEWASYCNGLDKKSSETEKQKLATLLMLGRSFRVHIIVSQQRADAAYFNTARENFNVIIGLGNLSQESQSMVFHEFKDHIKPDRKQGTGYMTTNGTGFTPIVVPVINNMEKLHQIIRQGVIR